ncbi:MAG: LytTR family DNA-binding domain-containing protein [Lachnospiraceae bacterium]|nr:LytTR family DNA-binding domain-containing protein [Lachnospiraceae bacterium]
MIKVALCDNDIREVTNLRDLVADFGDFEIHSYFDPLKLSQDIEAGSQFDIYILDIVMTGMSGLNLAKQIRLTDETAFIIFLTCHDGYALAAYGVRAFQYLLKPVDAKFLYSELSIARNFIVRRDQTLFPIKTPTGLVAVPFHEIAYCRSEGRRLVCVQNDNQVIKSSTLRIPFSAAIKPLFADNSFVQTHISFIVNLNYVSCIKEQDFLMKDKTLVPIAQRHFSEAKESYLYHVFGGESHA